MNRKIAVADIHGCYNTFRDLLDKCQPELVICIGDLVDRGRYPMHVINWFIQNENMSYCTLGNHDIDLLKLSRGFQGFSDIYSYQANGGLPTDNAYEDHPEILEKHGKWIEERPSFLLQEDIPELDGNPHNFAFSHACYSIYERYGIESDLYWSRANEVSPTGKVCVYGHTPVSEVIPRNGNIGIDTGCVYGHIEGFGRLTALDLDTLEIVDVPFNEKDRFKYPGEV